MNESYGDGKVAMEVVEIKECEQDAWKDSKNVLQKKLSLVPIDFNIINISQPTLNSLQKIYALTDF